jgi:uncharacterized protein (TIGR02246 family)
MSPPSFSSYQYRKMYTMSRLFFPWLFLSLFAALVSAQSANAPQEAEIRKVIQKYLDARERRDPKAVAEVFTPDADQLVSSGEWRKGRAAIVRGTLASSESTGGHRSITIQTIRFLAPTVALADGPYELTGLAGGENRSMWTTFLLTRGSNGWLIAAIRNMRPSTMRRTRTAK